MAPVTHIVALKFGDPAIAQVAESICADFFKLKETCVKPDGKPYIVDIKGGRDISIEGIQKGFTHLYIVSFASVEDRDYYVKEDAAHRAFGGRIIGAVGVEGVLVLDINV